MNENNINNDMKNFVDMFKTIKNPQEAIFDSISSNGNPMLQNALKMAKNNDIEGVSKLAENLCKEKGIDFQKEFTQFMSYFK